MMNNWFECKVKYEKTINNINKLILNMHYANRL